MTKNIHSHNSDLGTSIRQFVLPSPLQFFLCLLVGMFILMFLNSHVIWQYFNNDSFGQTSLRENIDVSVLPKISSGKTLQILFWVILGCATYISLWLARSVLTNLRNDITADVYVHPPSYSRGNYWKSIIFRKLGFTLTFAILIGFVYFVSQFILSLSKLSYWAIVGYGGMSTYVEVTSVVVCIGVLVHIFLVLAQATVNSWRLIYTDL